MKIPVRKVVGRMHNTGPARSARDVLSCGHSIPACYRHGLLQNTKTRRCYTCHLSAYTDESITADGAVVIEKFKDGETVAEYRERRRNARKNAKMTVQRELRVRDGVGCRWPGCEFWQRGYRVENAHLEDSGMGGDPALIRTQRQKMIRLCIQHHQGRVSIHSKDLRVVPLTDKGTDGPCEFQVRNPKAEHGWETVGGEDDFTFARRRNESAAEDSDEDEC